MRFLLVRIQMLKPHLHALLGVLCGVICTDVLNLQFRFPASLLQPHRLGANAH